jgi:hypothetical protein
LDIKTNPYQASIEPSPSRADTRRVTIALVPFVVAGIALTSAVWLWIGRPLSNDLTGVVIGVLGSVLVFDLATCVYVLVKWQRNGIPPDLVSELMMTTSEERAFHGSLRARPKLKDDEFYDAYYAQSGVAKHLVTQLRRVLEHVSGCDLGGLQPGDNLAYVDGELDIADVLDRIERELNIQLDWDELRRSEVTFDFLVRVVARCVTTNRSGAALRARALHG